MRLAPGIALVALALALAAPARGEDADAAAADALPDPPVVHAGEVPLTEPIAPVPPGQSAWLAGVLVQGGLGDAFYGKVSTLAFLRRGFGRFGVEAFGGRAFSWASPSLDLCSNAGSCGVPGATKLGAVPGNLDWLGGVAGTLRAAEGKLSFAGLEATRFGVELGLGAAAVGYLVNEGVEKSRWAPGARGGLALALGVSESLEARVALDMLVYAARIRGARSYERQLFGGVSLAWRPGGAR